MTPFLFVLLAVAGGVGATARFVVDGAIRSSLKTSFQWATSLINMSGSLVLGFLTGLTVAQLVSTDLSVVLGTGFLGGYTTFSTASYETVELIKAHKYGQALLSGVGMLAACVVLASLGYWAGSNL